MFVRIVNFFLLIFTVNLCITQGINSSINDVDYLQFKRFVSQQISLLKNNNKIDKNTPLGKLLRKSENEGNFGIQEDSEFYLGNIKCWRFVNFFITMN